VTKIQKRAGKCGSATKESEITWLTNRRKQDHVVQIQRRAGPRVSATKDSRTTCLSYKR
jgi:hypothetical protein